MAGGKETPRQKMIGMMYLVLTALLALNVSKEILDAFVLINDGLESTKITFKDKISDQYAKFDAAHSENEQKYRKNWERANKVKGLAQGVIDQVDQIKAYLISQVEQLPMEQVIASNGRGQDTVLSLQYVKSKDNQDVNTNVMIGENPGEPRKDHPDGPYTAFELKNKLDEFKTGVADVLNGENPLLLANIEKMFNFEDRKDASGTTNKWEAINFYHVPLAATITNLSKIQTDVRNSESDVVTHLMADVEAASFKFTKLVPIAIPQSNYVLEGDSFRADVFLAAYDDTNFPKVEIATSEDAKADTIATKIIGETREVTVGADGFGKLRIPANKVGFRNWKGLITFKGPKGEIPYLFEVNYEVAKPALVISPTKMNVFYRGVENPVSISVPGFSAEKIKPSITNGTLKKTSEGWVVLPGSASECVINVSVETDQGDSKSMGSMSFRCKNVPKPLPTFAGLSIGDTKIQKTQASAQLGVGAKMDDFVFDLQYPVVSFEMTTIIKGEAVTRKANTNKLTPEMTQMLQNIQKNQKILIENIRAKAPDGSVNPIGNLSFTVY
jgi:gliding motility-associated protein GldM